MVEGRRFKVFTVDGERETADGRERRFRIVLKFAFKTLGILAIKFISNMKYLNPMGFNPLF
jgi:hypothetical protein